MQIPAVVSLPQLRVEHGTMGGDALCLCGLVQGALSWRLIHGSGKTIGPAGNLTWMPDLSI